MLPVGVGEGVLDAFELGLEVEVLEIILENDRDVEIEREVEENKELDKDVEKDEVVTMEE